jgi:WXXGXW repeat (2 copies)
MRKITGMLAVAVAVGLMMGLAPSSLRAETIVVTPPAVKVEVIPERPPGRPAEMLIWDRGHWARIDGRWDWVPGHWIERPRPGAAWVAGHWNRHGREFVWVDGRWR